MIQNVYGSLNESRKQLYCIANSIKDSVFDIDITKNYKITGKTKGVYGSTQENCWFNSMDELVELVPNKIIIILSVSGNYVKVVDENRVYWVHKYCLELC